MFYYYYDWTYILVLIGVVICMAASGRVNSVFTRYSRVRSHSGMTGKEAAERILRRNGIYDVQVIHIPGNLTDHYNPGKKTLGLSDTVYNSSSVAAIGVAAHECGHAVQHAAGYAPALDQRSPCPCGEFRLGAVLAADPDRPAHEQPDVGPAHQSGDPALLGGGAFSDRNASGGVQRLEPGGQSARIIGNAISGGSGGCKEGPQGGCTHLCGRRGIYDPAVPASDHHRRKKKE